MLQVPIFLKFSDLFQNSEVSPPELEFLNNLSISYEFESQPKQSRFKSFSSHLTYQLQSTLYFWVHNIHKFFIVVSISIVRILLRAIH